MKRPSGFDRAPERAHEPDPGASDDGVLPSRGRASASEEAAVAPAPAPGPEASDARDRPSLLRRRLARRAAAENSTLTDDSIAADDPTRTAGSAAADTVGAAAAPTVDLGEVREARSLELSDRSSRFSLARLRSERDADPVRAAERRLRAAEKQRRAQLRNERRRFSVGSRRKRRNWWIALAAVAALALFVVGGAFTPVMAVRDLQVVGAVNVNQGDVEQALSRFDGRPLALVDDAEVHQALEPFPMIQRYAVERVPPHTLVVRIEERVPVISVQGDAGYAVYDAAGVLLASAEQAPAGAPVASGAVTDFSSQAFRSAGRALRDMPAELRTGIVSVTASSGQDVTFTLSSGVEVLWGDADRTRYKAEVLERMIVALADRPVERIDVSSAEAPVFR